MKNWKLSKRNPAIYRIKDWFKNLPKRILHKLGYMEIFQHEMLMKYQRDNYNDLIRKLKEEKLDELVVAIRSVNMVKVKLDEPMMFHHIKDLSDAPEEFDTVHYERIEPPVPNWYGYSIKLDVARIQRIYEERILEKRDVEFEYFLDSLLWDIRKQMEILMRMRLGV